MDFEEEVDTDRVIIEQVKQHRLLWDKQDPQYKNKDLKKIAYNYIAEQMSLETSYLESRWLVLRQKFARERKLMTLQKKSDSPARKEWNLFHTMAYLNDHVAQRKLGVIKRIAPGAILSQQNKLDNVISSTNESIVPNVVTEGVFIVNNHPTGNPEVESPLEDPFVKIKCEPPEQDFDLSPEPEICSDSISETRSCPSQETFIDPLPDKTQKTTHEESVASTASIPDTVKHKVIRKNTAEIEMTKAATAIHNFFNSATANVDNDEDLMFAKTMSVMLKKKTKENRKKARLFIMNYIQNLSSDEDV